MVPIAVVVAVAVTAVAVIAVAFITLYWILFRIMFDLDFGIRRISVTSVIAWPFRIMFWSLGTTRVYKVARSLRQHCYGGWASFLAHRYIIIILPVGVTMCRPVFVPSSSLPHLFGIFPGLKFPTILKVHVVRIIGS